MYKKIANALKKEVEKTKANTPILSERELEKQFKVSRMTIRKAIDVLVEKGILYRIQNVGTFVSDHKLHRKINNQHFIDIFSVRKEYKVIHFNIKSQDENIYSELGIGENDKYIRILRLNFSNDLEQSIDEIYIVRKMIKKSGLLDIREVLSFSDNLIDRTINQKFVAMIVPVKYANLLKVKIGTPIVRIDTRVYTRNGNVYAFIKTYTNPDQVDIEITI